MDRDQQLRDYCDYIEQPSPARGLQLTSKQSGFAVYDRETFEELTFALAEHCATEGIDPRELAA